MNEGTGFGGDGATRFSSETGDDVAAGGWFDDTFNDGEVASGEAVGVYCGRQVVTG